MKHLLTLLLSVIYLATFGQKITKVACGEYRTCYLQDDSTVWATLWDGKYSYLKYGIKGAVDVAGGQYTCLAWTKDGVAYELGQNSQGGPAATKITIPGKVVYGQMFYQASLLINDLGDVYYLASTSAKDNDALKMGASGSPKLVLKGWNITKIACGENSFGLLLLTKNGEAATWLPGKQPVKVITSGVTDIAMIGRGVYVANTASGLKVWGGRCNYVGLPAQVSTPTTLNGPTVKKMVGNWNTLHIIDTDNDMWACGDNVMGEIGNGQGWPDWKTYKGADGKTQPFAWNWLPGQMIQPWVKLDGKWSDVFTSGSMAFYLYAIDTKGQLYSWGRNKKRALGNGYTLPDNDLDVKYPNWSDVWYPSPVNPGKVTWQVKTSFDPSKELNNASFVRIPNEPVPPVPEPIKKITITSNELASILKALKAGTYQFDISIDSTVKKVSVTVQ
jgi:alpha-tubulin suppressor-like RCC1 family protein